MKEGVLSKERRQAIEILEAVSERIGDETIFDCQENDDTRWFDLEDMIVEILERGNKK